MSGSGCTRSIAKRSRLGEGSREASAQSSREMALHFMLSPNKPYFQKLCILNMLQEKGVPQSLVEHILGLHYIFARESWPHLFAFDAEVDIEAVREFYAQACTGQGVIVVKVRGTAFEVTPETISQALGVVEPPRHSPAFIDEHQAFLRHPEGQWRQIVGDSLLPPGSPVPNYTQSTNLLPTDAKILYHIISHTLMPTKDPRKIVPLRLALVHSIMENRSLNVGQFLFDELDMLVRERRLRVLLYPMLITVICRAGGARVDPTHSPIRFKLLDLNKVLGADRQQGAPVPEEAQEEDYPGEGSGGRGDAPPGYFADFMEQQQQHWAAQQVQWELLEAERAEQRSFRTFITEEQLAFQAETRQRLTDIEAQFRNWHGFHQPPPQGD